MATITKTIAEGFGKGDLYTVLKWQNNVPYSVDFTVGTEASDAVNVVVQLKDYNGDNLTESVNVLAYVSTSSNGSTFDGIGSNGSSLAISSGGHGTLLEIVSKKLYMLRTHSDGHIDIKFADTGSATYYLVVVLPDGKSDVSGAIVFTA